MATTTQRLTLPILDPTCGEGGARAIERTLQAVPGVLAAYVNPATEMAYVQADASLRDLALLVAAVERAGFHAGPPSLR